MNPLSCAEAEAARLDAASGPIDPVRQAAYDRHVDGCARCQAFAADIDRLEDTLGEALREEGAAHERAAYATGRGPATGPGQATSPLRRAGVRRLRPALAAAAIAALVLVAVAGWTWRAGALRTDPSGDIATLPEAGALSHGTDTAQVADSGLVGVTETGLVALGHPVAAEAAERLQLAFADAFAE